MKLSFLGDVFLDKEYKVDIDLKDYIFNLEYPLSTKGIPARNKINLGSDTPNIIETFGKYPKAVNLANNHIMDYGEEAFQITIDFLKQNNIYYFGAGDEENNYNNPCIIDVEKKKIALLGYSCSSTHAVFGNKDNNGSALLDINKIIEDIQNCKKKVDMIVVSLHWGDEEIKYPKYRDVQIAHKIIDAGADLIVGHHAHVVQSIEVYNGKSIFYGVGNFIFPDFNVPSYYDGKKFLMKSTKKQQQQHKETIIINLDNELAVTHETAIFNNNIVVIKKTKIPTWLPKTQNEYDLRIKYIKRLGTIKRFIKNPTIPTIEQFKIFIGLK